MERKFEIQSRYLMIPVINSGKQVPLEIFLGEEKVMEFSVPFDPQNATPSWSVDFYGPLLVEKYEGQTLTLRGDFNDKFFDAVIPKDKPMKTVGKRPFIHFTAETGWTNDPNGLYYDDGIFHMYFQHNPFGKAWGNMCWGSAVSADLMHWEQGDDVLYPDELGAMFSGSALKDTKNILGHGADTVAYFYTAAGSQEKMNEGKPSVQCLALSYDDGMTLRKDGVILDTIKQHNRDPKVYFHEETGHYYMALFVAEPDEFAVLTSNDLRNWKETQRILLPGLRECPDLRAVPVATDTEYTGEEAWVFMAADGTYYIGSFDGEKFRPESECLHLYETCIPYAAQTFSGTSRVLLIPWLRTADPTKPYTSSMGIPRELTLRKLENGKLRVYAEPAYELAFAKQTIDELTLSRREGCEPYCTYVVKEEGAVELRFTTRGKVLPSYEMVLFGTDILYGALDHSLTVVGVKYDEKEKKQILSKEEGKYFDEEKPNVRTFKDLEPLHEMTVHIDGNILEISIDNGRNVLVFDLEKERYKGDIEIESQGETTVTVSELR